MDYSKLSDEELRHLSNENYSNLSEDTLNALTKEINAVPKAEEAALKQSTLNENRLTGAALGAAFGAKNVSPYVGGFYALKEIAKELKPTIPTPQVTVEAAPISYNTPHGVGQPGVNSAAANEGIIIKNKIMQEALQNPGYKSPGNSRLLMPEQVARTLETVAPAAQELSALDKTKMAVSKVGNVMAPAGIAGKVINTVLPVASFAGAGAQGADALERALHGDFGRATISGLGALGSAASVIPHPLTRALGTGAALSAPAINYLIDQMYGRSGYATGGQINFKDGGLVYLR
jgi:hypothetical protein